MSAVDEKLQKASITYIENLRREAESAITNYSGLSDLVFDNSVISIMEDENALDEIIRSVTIDKKYLDIRHNLLADMLFYICFLFEEHANLRRRDNSVVELRRLADFFINKMKSNKYIDSIESLALHDILMEAITGKEHN